MINMTLGIYTDYERELNELIRNVALFVLLADRYGQFETVIVIG